MTLFVPIENLVSKDHPYRQIMELVDFKSTRKSLSGCIKELNSKYTITQAFKMLLLQYMEDLSDRELERFLQENLAGKYFCDFSLEDDTPDHSYFGYVRDRIGLERLKDLFNRFRLDLKRQGVIREIFTFVDASQLKSKLSVWSERDKAIKAGQDRLTNEVIKKFARDKDARIGCKGKDNFWFGYKKARSVDMPSGLINKSNLVPANKHDSRTVGGVCPDGGAVYADKGYCGKAPEREVRKRGCTPRFIKRNNMIEKDQDLDRYLTKIRAPYERVFSKENKRARYVGIRKNLFAELMQSIAFNCKRLLKIREQIPKDFVLSAG
jgi:transposase, IS5 family